MFSCRAQSLNLLMWLLWLASKVKVPMPQTASWPCRCSWAVSAQKRRAIPVTGRECASCLSWLDLALPQCVNESVRWTTSKHDGGLSCWDLWPWHAPRHRAGGGGGGGGGAQDTLRHKGKGGPPNLQQLKKQAWIKMVICLVNFYRDLWAAVQVNLRGTYITHIEIVTLQTSSHSLRHMLSLILLNQSSLLSILQTCLQFKLKQNVFEYNSCDVSFTAVKWAFNTPPPYNPFEKILKTALLHYLHYLFIVLDKTSNAGLACVCMVSESEDQCRVCLNMFVQPAVNDSFTVGVCSRCVCATAAKTYSAMHSLLSWLIICCFQNW